MSVYVALLRGVNVGGRAKVDMRKLKSQFEKLGWQRIPSEWANDKEQEAM